MTNPPPGVSTFDHAIATHAARQNIIFTIYGATKTGKTYTAIRGVRPLYIAYLDVLPESTLDAHLLRAEADGFEGPVHKLVIPPIKYKLLTVGEAERRVLQVEAFAEWAKQESRTTPGGTLVLDGCVKFKGYVEKYLLGESVTLGFRPEKGSGTGISTFAYAKSNAYIMDFIGGFAGVPLDVVLTWEGRRKYVKDSEGNSTATDQFRSTMPESSSFAINAQVETLVELVPIVHENKRVGTEAKHKIRMDWGSFPSHLRNRTVPARGLTELKDLFLGDLPEDEVLDDQHEIVRANTEGLDG